MWYRQLGQRVDHVEVLLGAGERNDDTIWGHEIVRARIHGEVVWIVIRICLPSVRLGQVVWCGVVW